LNASLFGAYMKTITFRKVQMGENTLDYKTQLIGIMQTPSDPQRGAGIEEVRKSVRVLDTLDKAGDDQVELEDADYVHVVEKIKAARYLVLTKEVLQFIDDMLATSKEN